jgi:metal-responsive CopG/Arc/MetJ family transcriptional regulator
MTDKPTPPKPESRVGVNVRLRPASIAQLDAYASRQGMTRSEAIRQLLSDALARENGR